MSETTAQTPPALPLFFQSIVPLDVTQHVELRLNRNAPPRYAAKTNSVPIGLTELGVAAQFYPIAFTGDAAPVPVAILGYQNDENLFIDENGMWRPDMYVPAYIRAYPFILVEDRQRGISALAADLQAPSINRELGEPLFTDGKPTPFVQELFSFCMQLREDLRRAALYGAGLEKAAVLEPSQAKLTFKSGGEANFQGFKLINQQKFEGLDDKTFLAWRRDGWIGASYAQLMSGARWNRIIELGDAARASRRTLN